METSQSQKEGDEGGAKRLPEPEGEASGAASALTQTNGGPSPLTLSFPSNLPLRTLHDSITLIQRRHDDRRRVSQWAMDEVQNSPMITSPRMVLVLPDLARREEEEEAAARASADRRNKRRAVSLGDARDRRRVVDEMESLLIKEEKMGDAASLETRHGKHGSTMTLTATTSSSYGSMGPLSGSASPEPTSPEAPSPDSFSDETNPPALSVAYGLINFAIVLPVLMSFGSIIYRDEAFKPYQPVLVKLTVVSGIVHQLCFSTFSSLPFAVGQVQDAGLIFLSGIASNLATHCRRNGYDDEHMLATATIGLGLCTFLLGFGLVIIGKCGLARYVQSLPTPVVGGYLAFIGWFCGQSGLGLMAGVEVTSISQWYKFFSGTELMWLLPGLAGGVVIYTLVRKLKHMAVLPLCIVTMLVLFYVMLACTGTSVLDATNAGWISKADPPPVWYKTWDYLRPSKVVWAALPPQTLTLLSMIFVVALSSSLDVAAIELELKRPLDYNHELKTVGISNIVSGLTGGYTGSYIFSQSIFSLRAGIRSRLSGYVLALAELVSVLVPVPILSYVPNFFFGSLLVMICIDLMYEWLWDVRSKLTKAEYGIALGTFGLIQVVGVEYGIIGGVAASFACAKMGFDMGKSAGDEVDREANDKRLSLSQEHRPGVLV